MIRYILSKNGDEIFLESVGEQNLFGMEMQNKQKERVEQVHIDVLEKQDAGCVKYPESKKLQKK